MQSAKIRTNKYLTADHLGSPRIITDENGSITSRKDYMAFGEETSTAQRVASSGYQPTNGVRQGYTGYEQDTESGLEFAQARYYNSAHGRFTSVDPLTASANVKNPQTFNRYSYVLNSPYKYVDPLGLISEHTGASGKTKDCTKGCYIKGNFYNPSAKISSRPASEAPTSPPAPANSQTNSSSTAESELGQTTTGTETDDGVASDDSQSIFYTMWSNHLGAGKPLTDTGGDSPEHQCAMTMSLAMQLSNIDMSTYTGTTKNVVRGRHTFKVATNVYELVEWFIENVAKKWAGGILWKQRIESTNNNFKSNLSGTRSEDDEKDWVSKLNGKKGIIVIYDCYRKADGTLSGHIDLMNAGSGNFNMRRAGNNIGLINIGKSILFIPFNFKPE